MPTAGDNIGAAVTGIIESIGQIIGTEYDGLVVPGVRGELNELYWNAIVFSPDDRWLQLVDRSAQPQEVS